MALDATVAGAAANSYLTLAGANTLAGEALGREAAAWNAASDADKEKALIRATSDVDAYIGGVSARSATGQALLFPRATDTSSGTPYILGRVQRATFHQAAFLLANVDAIADADARRASGLLSRSDMDGGWTASLREPATLSSIAESYLRPLRLGRTAVLGSIRLASGYADELDEVVA